MTKHHHIVKSNAFEVIFDDQNRSNELFERIRKCFYDEIEARVCQKLDQHCPDHLTLSFDQVVLELGEIHIDDLERQLLNKIEEQLDEVLMTSGMGLPGRVNKTVAHSSNLSQLVHFLTSGYLSWNNTQGIERVLEEVLINQPKDFLAYLKSTESHKVSLKRLAHRFTDRHLVQLVTLIEPENVNLIEAYRQKTLLEQKKKKLYSDSQEAFGKTLWLVILNYLLIDRGSRFNTKSFLKSTIRQLSQEYKIPGHLLISALRKGIDANDANSLLLFEAIEELDHDIPTVVAKGTHDDFQSQTVASRIQKIINWILHPYDTDPYEIQERLADYLIHVLDEDATCFKKILIRSNHRPAIVRRFSQRLNEQIPTVILKGLETTNYESIVSYFDHLVRYQEQEKIVSDTSGNFKEVIWEIILTVVLTESESAFNQKSFLKGFIRSVAAHHNQDYFELLQKIYFASNEVLANSTARSDSFSLLIKEIYREEFSRVKYHYAVEKEEKNKLSEEKNSIRKLVEALSRGQEIRKNEAMEVFSHSMRSMTEELASCLKSIPYHRNTAIELSHFLRDFEIIDLIKKLTINSQNVPSDYHSFSRFLKKLTKGKAGPSYEKLLTIFLDRSIKTPGSRWDTLVLGIIDHLTKSFNQDRDTVLTLFIDSNDSKDPKDRLFGEKHALSIVKDALKGVPNYYEWGFNDFEEFIQHLLQFERQHFVNILRELSTIQQKKLIAFLGTEALGRLLPQVMDPMTVNVMNVFTKMVLELEQSAGNSDQRILPRFYMLLLSNTQGEKSLESWMADLANLLRNSVLTHHFTKGMAPLHLPVSGSIQQVITRLETDLSSGKSTQTRIIEDYVHAKFNENSLPDIPAPVPSPQTEGIFINNAGLVLLYPYLNYFFSSCGLLDGDCFRGLEGAKRGVFLLQRVCAGNMPFHEEDLVLNKILCGVPLNEPMTDHFEASSDEVELSTQMLYAIFEHWEVIKNSTPDGFRGSWLWREGRLVHDEKGWELTVASQPFDILLDHLPYTLGSLKLSWMNKPLNVNWR